MHAINYAVNKNCMIRSRASSVKEVVFNDVFMLVVEDGTRKVTYNMEKELKGEWVRWGALSTP